MTTYWTNFAKTADPNSEALTQWPQYDGKTWMHFSGNTGRPITQTETGLRADKLRALKEGLQIKLEGLARGKPNSADNQASSSNSARD